MALEAHRLGLPVSIYSASKTDPAAQVVSDWHQGSVDDARALKAFLPHCSVVTFESEFMDAELLSRLSASTGTRISPSPAVMGAIQDRLTQKMMLERHGLPTAPFHNVKDAAAAKVSYEVLGGKVVFKRRRFGYDG